MPQTTAPQQSVPQIDPAALLAWYDRYARSLPWRVSPSDRARGLRPDPYRVWLSEIMLQQTTIAAVRDYFEKFTRAWPNVEALAAAPLDEILAAWAGLGYYARARNLHATANVVAKTLGGEFPRTHAGLLALPGIGPYTAAAIAAICHDEPVAVVDGNVERVMARFLCLEKPVREAKPEIRAAVQAAVPARAGDFAQAMMDLGAGVCAPRRAACALCPLQPRCRASRLPEPTLYPRKAVKPPRPSRFGHAFIITQPDGSVWLRRRPDKGVLAKMTEVPGSTWSAENAEVEFPFAAAWRPLGQVRHVFTHFSLELVVWKAASETPPAGGGWWSRPERVADEALPSLFRKVLALADKKKAAGTMTGGSVPD